MTTKFWYNRDGKDEAVLREEWRWEAHYSDGSVLKQFDEAAERFHQFAEIEQSKLAVFKMVHDSLPEFSVPFDPANMKLVHFYRHAIFNAGTSEEYRVKMYIFGFERNGQAHGIAILPHGEFVLVDSFETVQGG